MFTPPLPPNIYLNPLNFKFLEITLLQWQIVYQILDEKMIQEPEIVIKASTVYLDEIAWKFVTKGI